MSNLARSMSSAMNVFAALDVSCKAYLLLDPALQQRRDVQDFVFEKQPSLALEVVGMDDKSLECLLVRAIHKGLTLKEVVSKRPEFASNLACILAALSRDPMEMRYAQLRVAASKLNDLQNLQLRNKVEESVSRNGNTLQFAEHFRGDTMIVLAACAQDARHAALAMEPLGTWCCSIAASNPGNLTKIANHLVNNQAPKKRKHDGKFASMRALGASPTRDQQVVQPSKKQVDKPSRDSKPSQEDAKTNQVETTSPSQKDTKTNQVETPSPRQDTKPKQTETASSSQDTKPKQNETTSTSQDSKPKQTETASPSQDTKPKQTKTTSTSQEDTKSKQTETTSTSQAAKSKQVETVSPRQDAKSKQVETTSPSQNTILNREFDKPNDQVVP